MISLKNLEINIPNGTPIITPPIEHAIPVIKNDIETPFELAPKLFKIENLIAE